MTLKYACLAVNSGSNEDGARGLRQRHELATWRAFFFVSQQVDVEINGRARDFIVFLKIMSLRGQN